MDKPINDWIIFIILGIALAFDGLMFSAEFATVYTFFLVAWLILFLADKIWFNKSKTFPFESPNPKRLEDLAIAAGAYAGFLVLASVFTQLSSTYDVIKAMSAQLLQAATPALANSVILMVISFAGIVTLIETSFFNGALAELIWDRLKQRGIWQKILICVLIGGAGALFHLTVRGPDQQGMIITFMFFTISQAIVFLRGSVFAAWLFHLIANLVAVTTLPTAGIIIGIFAVYLIIRDNRQRLGIPVPI